MNKGANYALTVLLGYRLDSSQGTVLVFRDHEHTVQLLCGPLGTAAMVHTAPDLVVIVTLCFRFVGQGYRALLLPRAPPPRERQSVLTYIPQAVIFAE